MVNNERITEAMAAIQLEFESEVENYRSLRGEGNTETARTQREASMSRIGELTGMRAMIEWFSGEEDEQSVYMLRPGRIQYIEEIIARGKERFNKASELIRKYPALESQPASMEILLGSNVFNGGQS